MHREFAQADIDDRHVLGDPPDRPGEVADVMLAALSRGLLTYRVGQEARHG